MRGTFAYPGEIDRVYKKNTRRKSCVKARQPRSSQSPQCSGEKLHFYFVYRSMKMNQQHSQDVERLFVNGSVFHAGVLNYSRLGLVISPNIISGVGTRIKAG